MYAFLRSPRWLAGHALALVAVVAFVSLGFWQLRRLDERQAYNALVTERLADPARPLQEVLAEVGGEADALAYRRVTATGRYRPEDEILLSTRSYQGAPGHHLLTPLELADGGGVMVDRGWVPLELDDPPVADAGPGTSGEVTVDGILLPPYEDRTTPEAEQDFLRQVDLGRIGERLPLDLAPAYVLAQGQDPPVPQALPRPGQLPPLDEGPHRSYAIQWFLFATVVAVGYPVLLRRTAANSA